MRFVDRHSASLFLEGLQLLDSSTNVVRHRVVVVPRPTAAASPSDEEEDPSSAARGILVALAVCMPFWMGVCLLLF